MQIFQAQDFAETARKYPPFWIQTGELVPGVQTIAELEVRHLELPLR